MNISLHTQGCIGRAENHTVISPQTRGCITFPLLDCSVSTEQPYPKGGKQWIAARSQAWS